MLLSSSSCNWLAIEILCIILSCVLYFCLFFKYVKFLYSASEYMQLSWNMLNWSFTLIRMTMWPPDICRKKESSSDSSNPIGQSSSIYREEWKKETQMPMCKDYHIKSNRPETAKGNCCRRSFSSVLKFSSLVILQSFALSLWGVECRAKF